MASNLIVNVLLLYSISYISNYDQLTIITGKSIDDTNNIQRGLLGWNHRNEPK